MGRVCLWFLGAAAMLLTIFYAAVGAKVPVPAAMMFFILSIVAFAIFLAIGIIWVFREANRRLRPLKILDHIECTYWTLEKQLKVTWNVCDYSASQITDTCCSAQFGEQIVDVGKKSLEIVFDRNAECINGLKKRVERLANDVEVKNPDKCLINIRMKPHGVGWVWVKKSIEVNTQLIKH